MKVRYRVTFEGSGRRYPLEFTIGDGETCLILERIVEAEDGGAPIARVVDRISLLPPAEPEPHPSTELDGHAMGVPLTTEARMPVSCF